ncbi:MAG: 2-succinyl-5-enolpyruvyl-6-hydroxy-3-cyclohexene-1-carboxylic-acid synthase [Candidatus Marinimicrobia bacterium]|nr:2-succinyl-5-enolpyruvyl-6-hydroxy-3-cyclohexene-1-carboxylic-acid synthase [Candidatus Neomarinimicrobiota bacterium]MBT7199320.1 2-succinyl-5-enolpyruvyl-6-hydroxy-3-cyclohexene-1-carboxylic-acid synthase [Candidatus Neomarinimicrobiota bacterium]
MINNLDVGTVLVEELTRFGVTQFIISPGSRSTPLTVAIGRHTNANTTVHYDERGAAFYALGHARATGIPAVLVCTSGTAVANYFPAVIEASMDNVPLIIISADRPPELIDVGANQAIFQQDIYGVYPRLALNLPPPDSKTSLPDLLSQIDALYDASTGNRPGPVHLNCQFREPLLPDIAHSTDDVLLETDWYRSNSRFTDQAEQAQPLPTDKLQLVATNFMASRRGLIVVGRSVNSRCNQDILQLAETLHLPVLPDIQSKLRFTSHTQIVNHFDLALLSDEFQQLKPDFMIQLGGVFSSKRLLNYLDDPDIYYVSVKETPERIDPNHQVNISIQANVVDFCQNMVSLDSRQNDQWLKSWQEAEKRTGLSVTSLINGQSQLSEPGISYQLSKLIPSQHALMLANSMSIREMEMFGAAGYIKGDIFANRGSSGIDGLLATAAGYGSGSAGPVTLLIGDLACLHDLNSLQLIKMAEHAIIMVVVNNDGGGIFSFLPVQAETDVFEPFFGTPHGLTLKHAASMFDLNYSNPKDMDEFLIAYSEATQQSEPILIELFTNRTENHHFHQQLFESLRESS